MVRSKKLRYFLCSATVLLLLLNFLPVHLETLADSGNNWESFSPEKARQVQSIAQLESLIDYKAAQLQVLSTDAAYLDVLSQEVQDRFHHGYSHYSLRENWIAALAGKLFWNHLSAIVLPDDLMHYPMAACSQQSIVVMELLRRKGIPFRKVGFDHHFALEARLKDKWLFVDTNMEPDFSNTGRKSFRQLQEDSLVPVIYANGLARNNLTQTLANPYYGSIGVPAAPNAAIFHKLTKVLSRTLWLFPLFILAMVLFYNTRQSKVAEYVGSSVSPESKKGW